MHVHVRLQKNKVPGLGLKSFYIYNIHLKLTFYRWFFNLLQYVRIQKKMKRPSLYFIFIYNYFHIAYVLINVYKAKFKT